MSPLDLFQLEKPGCLLFPADVVIEPGRRRARSFGVFENVEPVISDLFDQFHRVAKIRVGLARKADDDITGNRHSAARILNRFDSFKIIARGVTSPHHAKHPIAAGLYGQMDPLA